MDKFAIYENITTLIKKRDDIIEKLESIDNKLESIDNKKNIVMKVVIRTLDKDKSFTIHTIKDKTTYSPSFVDRNGNILSMKAVLRYFGDPVLSNVGYKGKISRNYRTYLTRSNKHVKFVDENYREGGKKTKRTKRKQKKTKKRRNKSHKIDSFKHK